MKYFNNSQWNEIGIKVTDTLPEGTIIDYDGTEVPDGYERVEDYSTDEIDTGKEWIDGRKIYRKVYSIGTLPNTTSKTIATGISTINDVISISGFAKRTTDNLKIGLPYPAPNYEVFVLVKNDNNIYITANGDMSAYTGYIVLEYTKTTD